MGPESSDLHLTIESHPWKEVGEEEEEIHMCTRGDYEEGTIYAFYTCDKGPNACLWSPHPQPFLPLLGPLSPTPLS